MTKPRRYFTIRGTLVQEERRPVTRQGSIFRWIWFAPPVRPRLLHNGRKPR